MFVKAINERTTGIYTATLEDESGVPIPLSSISALELWLYNLKTGVIINARGTWGGPGQDVKNNNNVTIHPTSGLLTWQLQTLDNVIVEDFRTTEEHRAVFRATCLGSYPIVTHQFALMVTNLKPVVA